MIIIIISTVSSSPSREQEKTPAGLKPLMQEAPPHCRALQLDAGPATWLNWPRTTYEPWRTAVKAARLFSRFLPSWTEAELPVG